MPSMPHDDLTERQTLLFMDPGSQDHEQRSVHSKEDKSPERIEHVSVDAAGVRRVHVTEEDSRRILRATDKVILVVLCWVYFLQILDKSTLGFSSVFGLQTDAHLVGNQYSQLGAAQYYAQIAVQPLSAFCLVKVPLRILMPVIVTCWGAALCGMGASNNFHGLIGSRVLLGFFEAACLPLFTIVVANWYRRAEQPVRIAAFYSTNGLSTLFGSLLAFGLGHIRSGVLHSYQIIFLFTGLITVITGPLLYWKLDNNIGEARFLSPEDRKKAVERLRANQTGIGSTEWKWSQVWEMLLDPKTWLFFAASMLLNVGASVANVFGPILIGSFGFDPYTTSLLNMPFGFAQFIIIMFASFAAYKFSRKSPILMLLIIPVIVGLAMLYAIGRSARDRGANLFGYYLLAFLFAGNPLLVSWIAGNTGGQTKKAALMSLFNAASAAGNIIGPFLFKAADKPFYLPGLRAVLGIFIALAAVILALAANMMLLNRMQARKRVKNGKPAALRDLSMMNRFDDGRGSEAGEESSREGPATGDMAFLDLTDRQNDEFQYVL